MAPIPAAAVEGKRGWTVPGAAAISPDVREASLAAVIDDFVRRLGQSPPPPGLPYLALEYASGTATHLLDGLSTHGIFRKYEQVLDLAGGLGATGRWLAGRRGCTVVVTAADASDATGGVALTRRAGLRGRVHHVRTSAHALPFAAARFTHAWLVETLPRLAEVPAVLAEAWRVVRPGGHVAVQDLVHHQGRPAPRLTGWRFTTAAARREALAPAGFVDIEMRAVSEVGEDSASVVAARSELQTRLAAAPELAALAMERAALAAALADGPLRVVQLFARRP